MNITDDSKRQPTLLFIPDISGFTKFLHETEMSHSEHIIRELLEAVIDANEMGLEISSLAGDAILFYRTGKQPTAAEILVQVQRMYVKFHTALRRYESQRICQCGACVQTNKLTLKFVIHYGDVILNKVKSISTLFGKELVVVHRLMKNDIPHSEYVLLTHQLLNLCTSWVEIDQVAWEALNNGNGSYDFGDIEYCYLSLLPLRSHIPEPTVEDFVQSNTSKVLSVDHEINAPIEVVFDIASDTHSKHLWLLDVVASDKTNGHITKNGSTHRCVMSGDDSDPYFTSHGFEISKDQIIWTDTNHTWNFDLVMTLRRIENEKTQFNISIFQKQNLIQKILFKYSKKKKLAGFYSGSLQKLNEYYQGLKAKGEGHSVRILLEPAEQNIVA